eukprot:CAMPEP_0176085252 /NCGR_PEP_ID=MMETSP0120_2-20121206/42667_1 /TAXON_ID=160619 /ORGANISM="Kryptoperidinium foliaceum, Strain CCMP 1326" /LENGTH=134 /DNA_ID=CAMNT_0017419067 /DNA_START=246 /DNA_END=646 /DNA_ORIENTATION=-
MTCAALPGTTIVTMIGGMVLKLKPRGFWVKANSNCLPSLRKVMFKEARSALYWGPPSAPSSAPPSSPPRQLAAQLSATQTLSPSAAQTLHAQAPLAPPAAAGLSLQQQANMIEGAKRVTGLEALCRCGSSAALG